MLRGVNVGGKRSLDMARLKGICEAIGLSRVRTYIQSGNVVFESAETNVQALENRIGEKIKKALGLEVAVVIRTKAELGQVVRDCPFAGKDTSKLHVTFLSSEPVVVPLNELAKAKTCQEEFSVSGKEVYLYCPDGYGRTKLSNSFFEKKLKVLATTRNWNTVNKLLAMA